MSPLQGFIVCFIVVSWLYFIFSLVRYRLGFILFKDEEFTEVKHLFAQDDTGAGFRDFAFQQTLVVLVVEKLDVTGSATVEAVFDRYVVDELLRLPRR